METVHALHHGNTYIYMYAYIHSYVCIYLLIGLGRLEQLSSPGL